MGRLLVTIVAVLGLFVAAAFGFMPVTPAGVQCPTASVQTLAVRDCCGRVATRAPRPGDRAFLQCRCAERKASSDKAMAAQRVDLFLCPNAATEAVPASPRPWVHHGYVSPEATWSIPPALRPPALS